MTIENGNSDSLFFLIEFPNFFLIFLLSHRFYMAMMGGTQKKSYLISYKENWGRKKLIFHRWQKEKKNKIKITSWTRLKKNLIKLRFFLENLVSVFEFGTIKLFCVFFKPLNTKENNIELLFDIVNFGIKHTYHR